mmetsp:Transcript_8856/g.34758  ORF Transcript_8856/g.34758 Transcript_8856/m.34758 type:complete len:225 (+) Transcript_8856:198-872(+)
MERSRAGSRAPRGGTRPSGASVPRVRIHRPPRRESRASSSSRRTGTGRMATRTGARRTRRRWSATEPRPRDSAGSVGRGTRGRVREGDPRSRRTTRSTGRSPRRSCRITRGARASRSTSHRQISPTSRRRPRHPAPAPTRSVCPGGTPTADRRSRSRRRITPRPSPSLPQPSATRVTSARSTCWSWWGYRRGARRTWRSDCASTSGSSTAPGRRCSTSGRTDAR